MRTLLMYPNIEQNAAYPQLGISSLSACVKEAGHEVDLLDYTYLDLNNAAALLSTKIAQFRPELAALSIRSFEWDLVKQLLPVLENADIPVVVGGPHPTAVPHEVMAEKAITFLVQGEGEETLVDLCDAMQAGRDVSTVEGCWNRTGDQVNETEVRPLMQDLDTLPFPDWDIWDPRHLQSEHYKMFIDGIHCIGAFETSRGCPYNCPYCMSSLLHELYRGKGRYHREKSIERTIDEVVDKKERYGLDYVNFVDETFLLKDERLKEFCDRWMQEVDLPFRCATRPETVTEERIRMAREAGADMMGLGIESGDPDYRKKVLNRKYSQDQVRKAVDIIKRHGIIAYGFFIIGMPYETRETIEGTYELIQSLNLDHYVVTLCYPFKGTPFFEVANEEELWAEDRSDMINIWEDSHLSLPNLPRDQLVRLRYLVSYFARKSSRWKPIMTLCENSPFAFKIWKFFRRVERRLFPAESWNNGIRVCHERHSRYPQVSSSPVSEAELVPWPLRSLIAVRTAVRPISTEIWGSPTAS